MYSAGSVGDADEDDDSSSSTSTVEDVLETFRNEWRQEVLNANNSSSSGESTPTASVQEEIVEDDNADNFEEARQLFLKGVEFEKNGELYDAIQFYKKAVALVPDIEFKAFKYAKSNETTDDKSSVNRDTNGNPSTSSNNSTEIEEEEEISDLVTKFMIVNVSNERSCRPEFPQNETHISSLPIEIIINILKWVISSDMDLTSLERFSEVCRGFYLASRSKDIWRLVCLNTWGASSIVSEPKCWRKYFIETPRINLNGCYIAKVTYLREGERGFQDEFYRPWHVVQYYRFLRFFPNNLILMNISADHPSTIVKHLNRKLFNNPIANTLLFGDYRIVKDRVICVLTKRNEVPKPATVLSKRKRRNSMAYFDVPDQEMRFELEIKGKRNKRLQWIHYEVVNKYKNGRETHDEIDVSNVNNYPPLIFSQVKSYNLQTFAPLS